MVSMVSPWELIILNFNIEASPSKVPLTRTLSLCPVPVSILFELTFSKLDSD